MIEVYSMCRGRYTIIADSDDDTYISHKRSHQIINQIINICTTVKMYTFFF